MDSIRSLDDLYSRYFDKQFSFLGFENNVFRELERQIFLKNYSDSYLYYFIHYKPNLNEYLKIIRVHLFVSILNYNGFYSKNFEGFVDVYNKKHKHNFRIDKVLTTILEDLISELLSVGLMGNVNYVFRTSFLKNNFSLNLPNYTYIRDRISKLSHDLEHFVKLIDKNINLDCFSDYFDGNNKNSPDLSSLYDKNSWFFIAFYSQFSMIFFNIEFRNVCCKSMYEYLDYLIISKDGKYLSREEIVDNIKEYFIYVYNNIFIFWSNPFLFFALLKIVLEILYNYDIDCFYKFVSASSVFLGYEFFTRGTFFPLRNKEFNSKEFSDKYPIWYTNSFVYYVFEDEFFLLTISNKVREFVSRFIHLSDLDYFRFLSDKDYINFVNSKLVSVFKREFSFEVFPVLFIINSLNFSELVNSSSLEEMVLYLRRPVLFTNNKSRLILNEMIKSGILDGFHSVFVLLNNCICVGTVLQVSLIKRWLLDKDSIFEKLNVRSFSKLFGFCVNLVENKYLPEIKSEFLSMNSKYDNERMFFDSIISNEHFLDFVEKSYSDKMDLERFKVDINSFFNLLFDVIKKLKGLDPHCIDKFLDIIIKFIRKCNIELGSLVDKIELLNKFVSNKSIDFSGNTINLLFDVVFKNKISKRLKSLLEINKFV